MLLVGLSVPSYYSLFGCCCRMDDLRVLKEMACETATIEERVVPSTVRQGCD